MVHLEDRGFGGLRSNPQTLELLLEVAMATERGLLPSKGNLFTDAVDILRREHGEAKADAPLITIPGEEVLETTFAVFATLIMTGKEAHTKCKAI